MMTVNAMGKPCPIPVIEARKAMAKLPPEGGQVQVLVDNEIACQNLEKMAVGSGAQCSWTKTGDAAFAVTISAGQQTDAGVPAPEAAANMDFVVAVGTDHMGEGSEELGRTLLKGFVYALGELEELPGCILFFNGGARLTTAGAATVPDLAAMQEKGVKVYTCGTCADYYGIKDKLAVGEITNMYGIVTAMAEAKRLISL